MAIVRCSLHESGRTTALTCLFLLLITGTAFAAGSTQSHRVQLDADQITRRDDADGARYVLDVGRELQETGAPALPVMSLTYVVPEGSRLAGVKLVGPTWRTLGPAPNLATVAPLISDDGHTLESHPYGDALAYRKGLVYPPADVLARGTSHLHGYALANVELFPVRITADGRVEQLQDATVELSLEPDPHADEVVRRLVSYPGLEKQDASEVRAVVANPADATTFAPPRGKDPAEAGEATVQKSPQVPEGEVDYVIVTDASLVSAFQALADFKTHRGIRTAVVTVDWILANYGPAADPQESIRMFLKAAYANWGLKYVLLGGDSDIILPRYALSYFYPGNGASTEVPADIYFAALDGTWNADGDGIWAEAYNGFLDPGDEADLVAELSIGRAPVNNLTQATTFVNKVIEFEQPSEITHQGNGLFLSEVLFPANWNGVDPITQDGATFSEDIIFNRIIAGGNLMQSWRNYENYAPYFGAEALFKAAALDSINSGHFGLVNHIGHGFFYNMSVGDANIFVEDAQALTNGPNYFLLYALNCSSAAFDFNCLLETYIQNPNGGSAASLGACRAAFASTADDYQQGFYDEIFVQKIMRIGDAVRISRAALSGSTFADTPDRWTHLTYTLLGDPTMQLWRQAPLPVSLTVPATVELGTPTVLVKVLSNGQPIIQADVALTRVDMPGVMVTAKANLAGEVTLPLTSLASATGTIDVMVSGQNAYPTAGTVDVVTGSGPHVLATLDALTDDGTGGSVGDGDGMPDSGETVSLTFDFDNNGDGSSAVGVSATLLTVDAPGVNVLDDTIAVGTLAGGANTTPTDAFLLQLQPSVTDGELLRFQIQLTDGIDTWTQDFELTALAPELKVVRLTWDDSALGNGDGIIQNGEQVDLLFEVRNRGAGQALGITANLSSTSGNVTIVDGTAAWPDLNLQESDVALDALRVSESDTSVENMMTLTLQDAWGHVWTHRFELRPPLPPTYLTTSSLLGPNTIAVLLNHDYQPHFAGYRVYRGPDQAGPFQELTRDALDTTGFYRDDNLANLTRYYYYATVADSSAVESVPSAVVAANTAPPEMTAFPLPINRELAGATGVGDLRGDGTLVATFGADYIYALDADGHELVDGDTDSQTLGPLGGPAPPNDRFTPSGVALGNLDGDPADEVVGANWNSKELWALNGDGTSVPGFPVSIGNKAWCHPSIGDLDHDGTMEIVIRTIEGRTWVFNHDGTDFFDGDANPATTGVFHVRTDENFTRGTTTLVDLDGDQTLEIVFPTHVRNGGDNYVYALRNDATNAPGWPKDLGPNGYGVTGIVAADLDRDGTLELIYPCDNDTLYVWEPDGSNFGVFPKRFISQGANLDSVTPGAAAADFDKDGDLELVLVSVTSNSNCYVYVYNYDFTVWPGWPRQLPGRSETSPVIGDINGDDSPDILVGIGGGSDTLPNQLYAFNMDGTDVAGFPITLGGSVKSTPVITDFDGDGDVDIVYAGFDLYLHVWDMPYPYHPWATPWPTFHANARRTGVYGEDIVSSVGDQGVVSLPARVVMHPNVPNPFNPSTTIHFEIPAGTGSTVPTELAIYDVAGRQVRMLVSEPLEPGGHDVTWNGRDDAGQAVGSGVYFARLSAAGQALSRKLTLLK